MSEDILSRFHELRGGLQALRILNEAGQLDQEKLRVGLTYLGNEISECERLSLGRQAVLPILTLDDIARQARAKGADRAAFTVINGGRHG